MEFSLVQVYLKSCQ